MPVLCTSLRLLCAVPGGQHVCDRSAVPQLQLFFVLLCTLQDRFRGELEDATWLLRSCNLDDSIDTNMGKWSPHMFPLAQHPLAIHAL